MISRATQQQIKVRHNIGPPRVQHAVLHRHVHAMTAGTVTPVQSSAAGDAQKQCREPTTLRGDPVKRGDHRRIHTWISGWWQRAEEATGNDHSMERLGLIGPSLRCRVCAGVRGCDPSLLSTRRRSPVGVRRLDPQTIRARKPCNRRHHRQQLTSHGIVVRC